MKSVSLKMFLCSAMLALVLVSFLIAINVHVCVAFILIGVAYNIVLGLADHDPP